MSKRKRALFGSGSALLLGGVVYVLFRPDTYVAHLLDGVFLVQQLRNSVQPINCVFLRCYFSDFLWAFALCCGLLAVTNVTRKGAIWCGVITVGCGWLWECLQWVGLMSGTGDFMDMLLYLAAVVVAGIMYVKGLDK